VDQKTEERGLILPLALIALAAVVVRFTIEFENHGFEGPPGEEWE